MFESVRLGLKLHEIIMKNGYEIHPDPYTDDRKYKKGEHVLVAELIGGKYIIKMSNEKGVYYQGKIEKPKELEEIFDKEGFYDK